MENSKDTFRDDEDEIGKAEDEWLRISGQHFSCVVLPLSDPLS